MSFWAAEVVLERLPCPVDGETVDLYRELQVGHGGIDAVPVPADR